MTGPPPGTPSGTIRLIAAMDTRRGIATATGLPWRLPGDTAYFRRTTTTGAILMGRATYEEFAAPLHDRVNFVLTRSPGDLRTGFRPVGSLDQLVAERPGEDVWVIGGGAVYAATIGEADQLLLTQVEGDFHCVTFFPPYREAFRLVTRSDEHRDGGIGYRFETWQRAGASGGGGSV